MIKNVIKSGNWMSALAIIMATCIFSSCSNGVKGEMMEIFHTVPADAGLVVSGNLEKIADQAGADVKDGKIVSLGDSGLFASIAKASGINKEETREIEKVLSMVKAGGMVMFSHQGEFYFTCFVDDKEALKAAIDKEMEGAWDKNGEVEFKKEVAFAGDRLWLCDHINPAVIADFMKLSETQSFLSCEYAEKMAESDEAMEIWGSIDNLLASMPFGQQTQVKMGLSMLFDSPKFLTGDINFNKKGVELEMMPMTNDYKASKCVFDLSKIDTKKVASLEGNANMIFAIAISTQMVDQIKKFGASMGGALPAQMFDMLSPLDGTTALASQAGASQFSGDGFRAVVTTNGKQNAALGQMLATLGNVDIQGNDFRISKGAYGDGALNVAATAGKMEGSWLAIAQAVKEDGFNGTVLMMLKPADGGLKIVISAEQN